LDVAGYEAKSETYQQDQKERNGKPDAPGQYFYRPQTGTPVMIEIEKPRKQAAHDG
jgi:hypothetical protein